MTNVKQMHLRFYLSHSLTRRMELNMILAIPMREKEQLLKKVRRVAVIGMNLPCVDGVKSPCVDRTQIMFASLFLKSLNHMENHGNY